MSDCTVGLLVRFVVRRDFIDSADWQNQDDVPPEASRHFADEALSIYWIPNVADLPRTIAAFAMGRPNRLQATDCLYVPANHVDLTGLEMRWSEGDVPDSLVKNWHWEILGLNEATAQKLTLEFAKGGKCVRVPLGIVKMLVRMASDRQYFDVAAVSDGVRADIVKTLAAAAEIYCVRCRHREEAHSSTQIAVACAICDLCK